MCLRNFCRTSNNFKLKSRFIEFLPAFGEYYQFYLDSTREKLLHEILNVR